MQVIIGVGGGGGVVMLKGFCFVWVSQGCSGVGMFIRGGVVNVLFFLGLSYSCYVQLVLICFELLFGGVC